MARSSAALARPSHTAFSRPATPSAHAASALCRRRARVCDEGARWPAFALANRRFRVVPLARPASARTTTMTCAAPRFYVPTVRGVAVGRASPPPQRCLVPSRRRRRVCTERRLRRALQMQSSQTRDVHAAVRPCALPRTGPRLRTRCSPDARLCQPRSCLPVRLLPLPSLARRPLVPVRRYGQPQQSRVPITPSRPDCTASG